MAIAPADGQPASAKSIATSTSRPLDTRHLKVVPPTKALRDQIRVRAAQAASQLDKTRSLGKDEMESFARGLLAEIGREERYLGWTMVALVTAFWHDQVAAIPPARRLFLIPSGLKHTADCGVDCGQSNAGRKVCGACEIESSRLTAEVIGYTVLVAEGSSVLQVIASGQVDAIVGVASLDVLEKAIDSILSSGIPCLAVPLLSGDGDPTSIDADWVAEMIRVRLDTPPAQTRGYVHLIRAAAGLFDRDQLERLAPRIRKAPNAKELNAKELNAKERNDSNAIGLDPVAGTEMIAYDFLAKGGKHSRPFITLAVYDALTGGKATLGNGAEELAAWPDAIKRTALSIETFHKASLVHDDIEDDDGFRYGEPTLHRRWGIPTAINVGDYLIGLGYRLVSREAAQLGSGVAADILDRLADAHMKLAEGQGAELLWRDARDKQIGVSDALKIYALKTAPAFEAALYAGARLAGPAEKYSEPMTQFARHLGTAFQILNDLGDWQQDGHNKLVAGGDVLGGRPTVLWALALEALDAADARKLAALVAAEPSETTLAKVRELYEKVGVFEKATRLVEKYQQRAEAVADEIAPDDLRRLLYYLIVAVLDRPKANPAMLVLPNAASPLPIASQP